MHTSPEISGSANTLDELHRALEVATHAARDAAAILQEGFRHEIVSETKDGLELVTEYDGRCEELILGRLETAFPRHRIVGEEGGDRGPQDPDSPTWYVDPLDGTVNFAHHLPWYAVSIGLWWRGQGQVGVIVAPETNWELTAIATGPARLNGQPVKVSSTPCLKEAVVATGFPYDRRHFDNIDYLKAVLHRARGIRRMGTACLDCLAVACGWLDGYWERELRPWDVAAGAMIAQRAGARVTALDGSPFDPLECTILAANPTIHQELDGVLSGASGEAARS